MALTKIPSNLITLDAIDGTLIADDAIDSEHIANGAIDAAHMSANSIDSDSYVDGSIDTVHIGDDQVTADKLANSINTSIAAKLPLAGGTMTGNLDINGNQLILDADADTSIRESADDYLIMKVGGTDLIKIDASGLGIGIRPAEMLDIQSAAGDARIRLDAPASSDTEIKFYNAGAAQYTIGHDDATDNFVIGGANVDIPLVSVNKSGNLGIGTDSPSANLHLYDTASDKPHLLLENYGNRGTGDAPILEFYLNDQTTGGINDDTQVGVITFAGDEKDGGTKEIYGQIRGVARDPGSGSSNKGTIDFMIQKDGALTQTMALSNGKVGIGIGAPTQALDVGGYILMASGRNDNVEKHAKLMGVPYDSSGTSNIAGMYINGHTGGNYVRIGGGVDATSAATQISFHTAALTTGAYEGTTRMKIIADGKVGIGSGTPAYTLDVDGDINFTGTLREDGTEFSGGISMGKAIAAAIVFG